MKTGYKLTRTAIAAAAFLGLAPATFSVAQTSAAGGVNASPGLLQPEYLVLRSDVVADMGLKVAKDASEKAVLASLTAEQKKRLGQIALQIQGISALRVPSVQKELNLSADQARRLDRISDETLRHYRKTRAGNLDAKAIAAAFDAQRKKTIDDSLGVLTDAQRAAWQAMNGPVFKVDRSLGIVMAGSIPTAQSKRNEKPLLQAGTTAPDFEARTADGKTVRLSDYRGKVVVLDFWATWCDPCLAGLPNLEQTARRTQGQDVVFLALNVWDKEAEFKKWVGINHELTLHFVRDPNGETRGEGVGALFNVGGIPTTYVIDRDGKVVGTPKSEPVARQMGGKSRPISTDGVPDKEMVEMLGKQGIRVRDPAA